MKYFRKCSSQDLDSVFCEIDIPSNPNFFLPKKTRFTPIFTKREVNLFKPRTRTITSADRYNHDI